MDPRKTNASLAWLVLPSWNDCNTSSKIVHIGIIGLVFLGLKVQALRPYPENVDQDSSFKGISQPKDAACLSCGVNPGCGSLLHPATTKCPIICYQNLVVVWYLLHICTLALRQHLCTISDFDRVHPSGI